jgi:hypothetical protein
VRIVDPDGHLHLGVRRAVSTRRLREPTGERATFERALHGEILRQTDAEGRVVRR